MTDVTRLSERDFTVFRIRILIDLLNAEFSRAASQDIDVHIDHVSMKEEGEPRLSQLDIALYEHHRPKPL